MNNTTVKCHSFLVSDNPQERNAQALHTGWKRNTIWNILPEQINKRFGFCDKVYQDFS